MGEWKVENIATLANGKKTIDISTDAIYPIYGGNGIMGYSNFYNASNVIIIGRVGAYCGSVHYSREKCWISDNAISVRVKDDNNIEYLYYLLLSLDLNRHHIGGAQPLMTQGIINNIDIPKHSIPEQKKIAKILSSLDEKIETNRKINARLEELAQALFKSWFIDNAIYENGIIANYLVPKRGKNLLTSEAIYGDVPVVAGGLEAATYHNQANTLSPVITISASGANAGFVNLWGQPVWASDSSFIDKTITPHVYFWYCLLEFNQRVLFDSQTGSAQPHIYPKHVGELRLPQIDELKMVKFDEIATPLFDRIFELKNECSRLASLRDTLLPKLMSGEIIPE